MKPSLKPGIRYEHCFVIPVSKTVPALYPEAEEFVVMPEVFATGFLVGFLEWACIKAINSGTLLEGGNTKYLGKALTSLAADIAGLPGVEGRRGIFGMLLKPSMGGTNA